MRVFEIVVSGFGHESAQLRSLEAPGPAALLDWTQRHAPGRKVEFFEGPCSLGRASFAPDTGVWTILRPSHPAGG